MVDEVTFYILIAALGGFLLLLMKDIVLFFFVGIGKHLRTLISVWLKHGVLDIEATDGGAIDFVNRKMNTEGAMVSERNIGGVNFIDAKLVPRSGNPKASKFYHLKGTGIGTFTSHAGLTIAGNPDILAALELIDRGGKKGLDPLLQKYADENHWTEKEIAKFKKAADEFAKKQEVELQSELKKPPKKKRKLLARSPLILAPQKLRLLKEAFKDSMPLYDIGQYRIMLKQQYIRGREERPTNNLMKYLGIALLAVVGVIAIIFLLPMIMEGLGGLGGIGDL